MLWYDKRIERHRDCEEVVIADECVVAASKQSFAAFEAEGAVQTGGRKKEEGTGQHLDQLKEKMGCLKGQTAQEKDDHDQKRDLSAVELVLPEASVVRVQYSEVVGEAVTV